MRTRRNAQSRGQAPSAAEPIVWPVDGWRNSREKWAAARRHGFAIVLGAMGILRSRQAPQDVVLYPEHTLGRSKSCLLRLSDPGVSALHAVIFWADESWFIKDLGSRNGTFLSGRRLAPGVRESIVEGVVVQLGIDGPQFELSDDGGPQPLLVAADDPSFYRWIPEGSLAIPNEDHPEALLYLSKTGDWCLESDSGVLRVEEHGLFTLGGRMFRLIASRGMPATTTAEDQLALFDAVLKFSVSSDEEHVALTVEARGKALSLGHRAHHYLLLTLARERLKPELSGIAAGSQGWIERLELERMLRQTQQHINLAVWRARRQFAEAGFSDAINVVERRGSELRLGPTNLTIERS
jgi:hypothetical protein